jgi:hypothetical protein
LPEIRFSGKFHKCCKRKTVLSADGEEFGVERGEAIPSNPRGKNGRGYKAGSSKMLQC